MSLKINFADSHHCYPKLSKMENGQYFLIRARGDQDVFIREFGTPPDPRCINVIRVASPDAVTIGYCFSADPDEEVIPLVASGEINFERA